MARILIVDCAGYVGSHCAKALATSNGMFEKGPVTGWSVKAWEHRLDRWIGILQGLSLISWSHFDMRRLVTRSASALGRVRTK
jgi:hypothetical protein